MRKICFAMAAAFGVASCGLSTLAVPASPSTVADKTVLDEQLGQGVELAYKAFRIALEFAADSGKLSAADAAKVAALDNKAYAATQAVQAAYRAGNAASYSATVKDARAAIAAALGAIKG